LIEAPLVPCTSSIKAHWDTLYRLLDPACYTAAVDPSLNLKVPEGHTWYALNAWFINVNGGGPFFIRKPNIYEALKLPAGTTITASLFAGTANSYIYYCDLAYAAPPSGDPEEAFYNRLNKLSTIPLATLTASVSAGLPSTTQVSANFPTFTSGILVGVSTHDAAWSGLTFASATAVLNDQDEISDRHQERKTAVLLMPFVKAAFPGITVQGATVAGNNISTTIQGAGTVVYQVLPEGW
jgi:hypothetical protein